MRTPSGGWFGRRLAVLSLALLPIGCISAEDVPTPAAEMGSRSASIDWSNSERISVVMTEYAFRPNRFTLREGQPYSFDLVNTGTKTHTWTAPQFFRSVVFRQDGNSPQRPDAEGSIEVPPGSSAEVDLAPLRPGHFDMECTRPLHGLFGMSGEIEVR